MTCVASTPVRIYIHTHVYIYIYCLRWPHGLLQGISLAWIATELSLPPFGVSLGFCEEACSLSQLGHIYVCMYVYIYMRYLFIDIYREREGERNTQTYNSYIHVLWYTYIHTYIHTKIKQNLTWAGPGLAHVRLLLFVCK